MPSVTNEQLQEMLKMHDPKLKVRIVVGWHSSGTKQIGVQSGPSTPGTLTIIAPEE
jgi:hypothetical protein